MKDLSEPVSRELLAAELEANQAVTVFRGLAVYDFVAEECPAVMTEVGRLREKIFRASGAGRGGEIDVDPLDFGPGAYHQLLAFDPVASQVVAMVRYQRGLRAIEQGAHILRTSSLFDYSEEFAQNVLPLGVELGRSLVNDEALRARLGLFALWRGLAALATSEQPFDYFFGNVTLYQDYPPEARDLLVATVEALYRPPQPMLVARPGLRLVPERSPLLPERPPANAREGVAHLKRLVEPLGMRLPSILQSYLSLSLGVWCGQTARDEDFGQAHEMAIVVPLPALEERARQLFGL